MTASQIITIIVSVVSASGVLGIGTRNIIARQKKQEERATALELGVQALLRDRMIEIYGKYIEKGYAPICVKESFDNMYNQYHQLGANGVMTNLYKAFMKLPTEKPNEEET